MTLTLSPPHPPPPSQDDYDLWIAALRPFAARFEDDDDLDFSHRARGESCLGDDDDDDDD